MDHSASSLKTPPDTLAGVLSAVFLDHSRHYHAILKGGEINLAQGSIVKKSGTYYAVYRIGDRQKWERVGPVKKDAEKVLAKRMNDFNTGVLPEEPDILFRDFAAKWLADYAKVSVKKSTFDSYAAIFRLHLIPFFGNLNLRRISGAHIQAFIAEKVSKSGLSPKSVVNVLVPMKELFKHAVLWGYMRHNPAFAIKRPRVEQEEMDFLKPEEITLFLSHVRPAYHALFLTAILTGMRRGELLGLKWGDIDWRSSHISVRRSLYRGTFVSPKSKRSVRRVIMSVTLKAYLEQHRLLAPKSELELVFCTEEGRPIDPDNMVKREFWTALERAGIRRIRFHDLRHTFATLLIANGENIKFVQYQLGHASATTTLDRYGHVFPGTQNQAAERLDFSVFGNSVRKLLENTVSEANPPKKETSEVVNLQRFKFGGGGRI